MALKGYIDRLRQQKVNKAKAFFPKVETQEPEKQYQPDKKTGLVKVTVAPGRSIGSKPPQGPGTEIEVTKDEAIRLKKKGFIL